MARDVRHEAQPGQVMIQSHQMQRDRALRLSMTPPEWGPQLPLFRLKASCLCRSAVSKYVISGFRTAWGAVKRGYQLLPDRPPRLPRRAMGGWFTRHPTDLTDNS